MLLQNLKILVTRPAHQAKHLCALLEAQGGQAILLPTIEIVDVENQHPLRSCQLERFDLVIFISTNAVAKALPILLEKQTFPPSLPVIAVGQRTLESLRTWGVPTLCPAPPFNTEQILAMSQLQDLRGKQIVIFRGEGGRELLAETLRQRGATVQYINVYRRIQPPSPPWLTPVEMITITSGEGLKNLLAMLENQSWIRHTPWVVMSQRLAEEARQLGVQAPIFVAPVAQDEGLLSAILQAAEDLFARRIV